MLSHGYFPMLKSREKSQSVTIRLYHASWFTDASQHPQFGKWLSTSFALSPGKLSFPKLKDNEYNVYIALQSEVNVSEYIDAGIEPSSIPASTSASVYLFTLTSSRNVT